MKDLYTVLEIGVDSTPQHIKKAYRQKAIKYHPDKHNGDTYFTKKFIEVKEAYDILSEPTKRSDYDKKYREYFKTETLSRKENIQNKKQEERKKEEEYFYDPYRPFYSFQDREVHQTPQFDPQINHWGETLSNDSEFFSLPKNIGKIVSGYTTLKKDEKPSTPTQTFFRFASSILVGVAISLGIIFGFGVESLFWILVWSLVPVGASIWIANSKSEFKHSNTYIGVNGFAKFTCKGTRDNIIKSYEINFNEITDLLRMTEVRRQNLNYVNTEYDFVWLNDTKVAKEVSGLYYDKDGNPEREYIDYWLNEFAERYWTVYLLDNMEKSLDEKGYLEFSVFAADENQYVKVPYIQLGIGYIKFLNSENGTTYKFNEIKRVYTKGTNLFIEHQNYEKKFFFFKSGHKNGIPLMYLSNRKFFLRAMDLLLGYKFS